MFITHINKLCQKHSRVAFLIIGVLIIIPFVFLWGSSGDFMRGNKFRSGNAGTMYGKNISQEDFVTAMRATEISLYLKYGVWVRDMPQTKDQWVQETVRRMWALHEAKLQGLTRVSDAELAAEIKAKFDSKANPDAPSLSLMLAFLKRQGLDGEFFDQAVREDIAIRRLEERQTAGVLVSPDEARQEFDRLETKFEVAVANLPYTDELKTAGVQPTDEEVTAWYAAKVEPFRALVAAGKTPEDLLREKQKAEGVPPEARRQAVQEIRTFLEPYYVNAKRQVRIAVFPLDAYKDKAKVTEAQIAAAYEKDKAVYQREEAHVQYIFLRVTGTGEQQEAKRKELEAARKKLTAGADFAEMAKKMSDDKISREKGGDVGFLPRSAMPANMEKAVFALNKGELSPVIEVENGVYLFRLIEKRNGRTLAEAHDSIQTELVQAETERQASQAAQKFGDLVYRAVEEGAGMNKVLERFTTLAAEERITVKDSNWFEANSSVEPFPEEVTLSKQASRLNEQAPLSESIRGDKMYFVTVLLGLKPGYLPAGNDPQVLEKVKAELAKEKAVAMAREKAVKLADEIQKKLSAGAAFAAAKGDLKFKDLPAFSRNDPPESTEARALLQAVANAQAGQLLSPLATVNGASLVYLKTRTVPTDAEFAPKKKAMEERVRESKRAIALNSYYRKLETEAKTTLAEGWRPQL